MPDLSRQIAGLFGIGFDGYAISPEVDELLARGVRCVTLFKRNIESARQVQQLCADLKRRVSEPLMIAIDHEGGRVMRFGEEFTPIPSARQIGETGDAELARQIGRVMARELRAVNIDMNFAPVLDVDTNPANPVIGSRSFGRDPQLVAKLGTAMIAGLQQNGVAACGKHFPGHGDTRQDSHLTLPRLDHTIQRLERIELPPFQAAADAGVAAVMTSHILFDAMDNHFPATMSAKILQDILRTRLRFSGVLFSDDLEMKAIADHFGIEQAVIRGMLAGVDLSLVCHDAIVQHQAIDALVKAVERGDVPHERIKQASERISRLFAGFVKPPGNVAQALNSIGCAEHRAVCDRIVRGSEKNQTSEADPTGRNG